MGKRSKGGGGNSHDRTVRSAKEAPQSTLPVLIVPGSSQELPVVSTPRAKASQSTLLWGTASLAASIVLTVVAGMKGDLRWLLALVLPFACIAVWEFVSYFDKLRQKRWAIVIVSGLVFAISLYRINVWLKPPAVSKKQTFGDEYVIWNGGKVNDANYSNVQDCAGTTKAVIANNGPTTHVQYQNVGKGNCVPAAGSPAPVPVQNSNPPK